MSMSRAEIGPAARSFPPILAAWDRPGHGTRAAGLRAGIVVYGLLQRAGYTLSTLRELLGFVAAVVAKSGDQIRMEWVRDSAFRFFPFMEHEQLGLTLHPFDLATNKLLAMVGRLEVRDWVDAINADRRLQPLGYLLWAACGKDPGYSPGSLLAHARRTDPLFGRRSGAARVRGRVAGCPRARTTSNPFPCGVARRCLPAAGDLSGHARSRGERTSAAAAVTCGRRAGRWRRSGRCRRAGGGRAGRAARRRTC